MTNEIEFLLPPDPSEINELIRVVRERYTRGQLTAEQRDLLDKALRPQGMSGYAVAQLLNALRA